MSILPPLGAFFCPRKAKMKKKTLYNIIMLVVIGLIAAGAVFFAGRHLGWFDGADAAVSAQVHKGLATLTRDGIASELTGETALRTGDVLTVTSGSTAVQAGGSTLTLSQGSKLQVESADKSAPRLRLTEGEVFCQGADSAATLLWGGQASQLRDAVLVCTVRSGSEELYVLGGQVTDGTGTLAAGKAGHYTDGKSSVTDADLQALSTFALECIQSCGESMFCTAEEAGSILNQRNQTAQEPTGENTCTIEIRCDSILSNMGDLAPGLDVYVPASGVILPTTQAAFEPGETVFDVLKRVCGERGIQLEYNWTPLYESYYVEGLNNLYEFSCGSESGWMFQVNGWFPNYGCSSYKLQQGDVIVWCYTCKGLGADVGAPAMK